MEKQTTVGMMLYCAEGDNKNVFTEEKYRLLADCFVRSGMSVETVLYNNGRAESLCRELQHLDTLLVWVNPIEQGHDRTVLNKLLDELLSAGVFVSAVPETIMKIGTKKVLFDTRNMEWGSDVEMYSSFAEFRNGFQDTVKDGRPRVLKQFLGNGGDGVYKVKRQCDESRQLSILHAKRGSLEQTMSIDEFYETFRHYFDCGGSMLNQEWNDKLANGMVRCYVTGKSVVGFGYQEINALFPNGDGSVTPGKRFYFTENCALFSDLKEKMQDRWINQLTAQTDLSAEKLPVIWDADFFINSMEPNGVRRYTLCEINVSSVSPFPESAIPAIVDEMRKVTTGRG